MRRLEPPSHMPRGRKSSRLISLRTSARL
uniref:Uncharacterized protein n=1 Tax=Anguilla anguilla TaxID=7936 RepID=A0A0E9QRX5_ANGAN